MDRRTFLQSAGALAAGLVLPSFGRAALVAETKELLAGPKDANFLGDNRPRTKLWAYNGTAPGPVLRYNQGDTLSLKVTNRLEQDTTVHWHGLRIPNAMDGVPYLTQKPIPPKESFTYRFPLKDAGTHWYHPHVNSAEQVGRGLAGALIIDEEKPIAVDRDLVWVLDDWRIGKDGQLVPFGGNLHDAAHGGRMGNFATINGEGEQTLKAKSNERVRLRLINVANARIFGLKFHGHAPWRIAVDGHPVEPSPEKGVTIIPPGGRVDLIIDMTGAKGESFDIEDAYFASYAYSIATISYDQTKSVRARPLPKPEKLANNPVAKPDLDNAEIFPLVFAGGAMGGMREARYKGEMLDLRTLAGMGMVWAVNGEIIPKMTKEDSGKPILDLKLGKTYQLRLKNDTAFDHPIHLHGHSFHLLARNGEKLTRPEIMDTVLIHPNQHADIAFVADNPGDWAFHCHVLEHAEAGMMGYLRVG